MSNIKNLWTEFELCSNNIRHNMREAKVLMELIAEDLYQPPTKPTPLELTNPPTSLPADTPHGLPPSIPLNVSPMTQFPSPIVPPSPDGLPPLHVPLPSSVAPPSTDSYYEIDINKSFSKRSTTQKLS